MGVLVLVPAPPGRGGHFSGGPWRATGITGNLCLLHQHAVGAAPTPKTYTDDDPYTRASARDQDAT